MGDTEARLRQLEAAQADLQRQLDELRREATSPPKRPRTSTPPTSAATVYPRVEEVEHVEVFAARPSRKREARNLEDFASPRNLALAGGLAVTLGLAFLVSYAVSHGWISEELRVVSAAALSLALAAAGGVLVEGERRGAPAMALLLAGLVGLFLTIVAATRLYDLISIELGVTLSTLVGIATSLVALRWNSEGIATLGLAGTLLSPFAVGATYEPSTLAFLAPVYATAMVITAFRRWPLLYTCMLTIAIVSVAAIQDDGAFTAVQAFGVTIAGATASVGGLTGRSLFDRDEPAWLAPLYGASAALLVVFGYLMITDASVPTGGDPDLPDILAKVWLFSFAAVSGLCAWRAHALGMIDTRRAALTAGVGAFAWGLAEVLSGPALVVSWSAAACVTLLAARHDWERGLGIALGLGAVIHAFAFEIPPDALGNGVDSLWEAWVAGMALVAICACGWMNGPAAWRSKLGAAAFGLVIYLVSVTIVDVSQPGTATFGESSTPSALDSEARGQVIVSSLWALFGLALVLAGLRRLQSSWRTGGLLLLVLAATKIAVFDLSSLSTAGRTISFIVVGMVLLAAAFAYQATSARREA
jgi:uncharacterized membrane protein